MEHSDPLEDPCLKVRSWLTKYFNLWVWLSDDGLAGGERDQTAGPAIKTTNWHAATGWMTHNSQRHCLYVLVGLCLHLRFLGVHWETNSLLLSAPFNTARSGWQLPSASAFIVDLLKWYNNRNTADTVHIWKSLSWILMGMTIMLWSWECHWAPAKQVNVFSRWPDALA